MEMSEEMDLGSSAGMNPGGKDQNATQEEMEAPTNPAYRQYLADRAEEERRASEAVMPSSMMAHCIMPTSQQQQQMQLYQQLGMVQQQQQHQQAGNLDLLQQLGGSSLLTRQPDLVPVLSSLHLV